MFQPETLRQETPSTYFVQDCANEEELTRLQMQDGEITRAMGGKVLEQFELDPTAVQSVLDVGCGTGGWLIETAQTYPTIPSLVGIDINARALAYAQKQAARYDVQERVSFRAMDALRVLDFYDQSFDLVYQRFGNSYLRQWDWPRLLNEYWRISQPRGLVLIDEGCLPVESTSPTLTRLFRLISEAFSQAGHFSISFPDQKNVVNSLTRLLEQAGFQNVRTRISTMDYPRGTFEARFFAADMKSLFRTILPFLQKWISVPQDYMDLYQQMLREVQAPDFAAQGQVLTLWGRKPTF